MVMSAIQFVKGKQEEIMNIFETKQQMSSYSKNIPVIQPALRWAQNTNQVFIEVKFATRFDSPACLDIFDSVVRVDGNQKLFLQAMCRNDKKLLKYELVLDLMNKVQPFEVEQQIMEAWRTQVKEYEEKLEEF